MNKLSTIPDPLAKVRRTRLQRLIIAIALSCLALSAFFLFKGIILDVVRLETGQFLVLYYENEFCLGHCDVSFVLFEDLKLINRGCRVFTDPLPPAPHKFVTFYSEEPPLFAVGEFFPTLDGVYPFLLCDMREFSCYPCDMGTAERDQRFSELFALNPELSNPSNRLDQ